MNLLYSLLLRRRYKCRVCLGYFSQPIWRDDGLDDDDEWEDEPAESSTEGTT